MEWTVNIEGKKDQKILVKFDPKNELIIFIGQYKPHNKDWIDFSEESYSMYIDLDKIIESLEKTYFLMKKRLDVYNNIAEGFANIKNIEIKENE